MNRSPDGLQLLAPAKINLGLEVLRRRPDGFHDINTIFAAIDLCDELLLRPRYDGIITCRVEGNDQLETDDRNLCVRAASALRASLGDRMLGLDIHLTKRIPIGAGLGGGSSDAASTLLGALRLWNGEADGIDLAGIALALGSDVPFFLHGGLAHATSRGELLTPIDLHLPYTLLLINPGIHIPTPWAYSAIGRTGERAASDLIGIVRHAADDPSRLGDELHNDFEAAVFAEHPLLQELKEGLYEAGAVYAAMSGSGATLFGLFCDREDAVAGAGRFPEYWTAVAGFTEAGPPTLMREREITAVGRSPRSSAPS
jgi:4-diphosphocytidyl-2-C-methyl-D-erythritol kinase